MATYSHLPSSDLLAGYTLSSPVSNFQFQVSKSYEPHRDLITQVRNETSAGVVSQYDYASDALGRRVSRHDSGLAFAQSQTNAFGYNQRSEVISAVMYTNSYGYVFDPIGNRLFSSVNSETNTYAANALNQYSNVVVHPSSLILHPLYDADGNMTATGDGWHYVWNGENRLVLASNATHVVTYAYDYQGRMVWKTVSLANAPVEKQIAYTWDDFNIIAERTFIENTTNITYNVWGLDLSDSLQGAGGIGGLLSVNKGGTFSFPAYDANGNITEYIGTDGTIAAHREYSAFGETTVLTGALADSFTHWWSTKPWCPVTGLSEYLYRKYYSKYGRWLSRDPILEFSWWLRRHGGKMTAIQTKTVFNIVSRQGENNEFAFLKNFSSGAYDAFGLACQYNAALGKCTKPKTGFIPSANGCGPAGSLGKFVPNDPMKSLPPSYVSCPFTDACNYHDLCYGWCNSVKSDCDYALYQAIEGACLTCYENKFSWWDPRGWIWLGDCAALAGVYYGAVSAGGSDPFSRAQEAGCESCCCK